MPYKEKMFPSFYFQLIFSFQKMKTSELLICITSVLLIVLMVSEGSPAQKWRPQGRFGKRTNEISNNPLWMILACKTAIFIDFFINFN